MATVIGAQAFLIEKEYSPVVFLFAKDELNEAATADLTVNNRSRH